jgi:glutathione S-transferase
MADSKPVLWHIPVSHFSEKARWALAYKSVEHERRTPLPGAHMVLAKWLTRGASQTLPVLRLDGETFGDSTAIIAALERRYPEPALYPSGEDDRRRALELEDFFDEQLGPQIRLVAWHDLRTDAQGMGELTAKMVPTGLRRLRAARASAAWFGRTFVQLRYGAGSDESADLARERVMAALDRLERELDAGGGEYLAGDSFSVADLTAAALFYPLVRPPEGPQAMPERFPAHYEEFREPVKQRPGYLWVEEMYRRHREPAVTSPRSPARL